MLCGYFILGDDYLMALFSIDNEVTQKQSKKLSLIDMAKAKFNDDTSLIDEISKYLQFRRQSRNYPTRISWDMQLSLLEKVPRNERVNCVHRSTVCGYRSIVFENNVNVSNSVTRTHINDSTNIVNKGF